MTTQPTELFENIIRTIQKSDHILVATHVFPDGDALGSQLALGSILESLGKKVVLYSETPASHLYSFMPGCDKLETQLPDENNFDAAIALDCGDRYRLGLNMEKILDTHLVLVIDHHEGHKEFGDQSWVEPRRSSTGEMIYELAQALGVDISEDAAFCLYTAIVSDTGSFKYDSTSARTFQVAGELVARGVKPAEVAGKLFDNYSIPRLQLMKEVLATLSLHADNRIATIKVTREMFAATGATHEDTEDLINFPRALGSVKIALFVKEADNNFISVSMRSKKQYNVAQVALKFGGGGHRNAAGFRVENRLSSEVMDDVLQELHKIL